MVIFIAILTAAAIGTLLLTVLLAYDRKRRAVILKLSDYSIEKHHAVRTISAKKIELSGMGLRGLASKWAPKQLTQHYAPILQQAGIPLKGEEMATAIGACTLLGIVLGGLVLSVPGWLIGGIIGSQMPGHLLKSHLKRRLRMAEQQLVDFLSFSANAMRAGNSLLQALDLAGREMRDPIGAEMRRTLREVNLGLSVDEALQRLVVRLPSADLDLVMTAVLIQRQVGGDLAGILDSIASTIRERQHMKAQVRTLTAQGRLSGYVIAGLPFVLLVVMHLLNPDYIELLWTEPLGLFMLGAGVVSQVFGVIVISKVIQVEI